MQKASRRTGWPRCDITIITLGRGRPQRRPTEEIAVVPGTTLTPFDAGERPLGVLGYQGIFGRGQIFQALNDFRVALIPRS
jgi:hypothetical protein